jgi:hypothetical protein
VRRPWRRPWRRPKKKTNERDRKTLVAGRVDDSVSPFITCRPNLIFTMCTALTRRRISPFFSTFLHVLSSLSLSLSLRTCVFLRVEPEECNFSALAPRRAEMSGLGMGRNVVFFISSSSSSFSDLVFLGGGGGSGGKLEVSNGNQLSPPLGRISLAQLHLD